MKIISGIDRVEELTKLVKAGIDELYCGLFVPNIPSHGNSSLNRREGLLQNLTNYQEAGILIKKCHFFGIPIYFTLNSFYSYKNYKAVLEQISNLVALGADGFIVSDISIINYIKNKHSNLKIILSVGGTVFNSESAEFYYKLGVDRITLPRHLSIEEISSITSNKIEFEIISLKDKCSFIDGFCSFYHFTPNNLSGKIIRNKFIIKTLLPNFVPNKIQQLIGKGSRPCSYNYSFKFLNDKELAKEEKEMVSSKIKTLIFGPYVFSGCSMCMLEELNKANIKYLKVTNRGRTTQEKVNNILFVRDCLNLLSTNLRKEEYVKQVKKSYNHYFGHKCTPVNCYFAREMWSLNG